MKTRESLSTAGTLQACSLCHKFLELHFGPAQEAILIASSRYSQGFAGSAVDCDWSCRCVVTWAHNGRKSGLMWWTSFRPPTKIETHAHINYSFSFPFPFFMCILPGDLSVCVIFKIM